VSITTETKKNPGDTGSIRIRKEDIKTPSDSNKTAEQLQAEIEKGGTTTPEEPIGRTVARAALCLAEKVFQWRGDPRYDQWARSNHIHTLAKAIKEHGKPLAPLLVMPVGESFYVIDGHHRLAAYDTAGWTRSIPVEVFAGSLAEARLRALACNIKDKLPMTVRAKSAAAWQIVKENLGDLTAQQVAHRANISVRQVKYMRATWKGLNEREKAEREKAEQEGMEREDLDLMELTWSDANHLWKTGETRAQEDFDQDEWRAKKAEEVHALMQRTNVAAGLMRDFEVTALALQMLSENLPVALIEQWARDYPELIEDLEADIARPDMDLEF
jgi:ParB-like chromosome segregation protein Spo0J